MAKKNRWMLVATGAIILSVSSLLLPVISYQGKVGVRHNYNILALLGDNDFAQVVFGDYMGTFLKGFPYETIELYTKILVAVGAGAIVLAFVGINSMSKQYESNTPFRLTLLGLVGTAIPSITLIVLYAMSAEQFRGTISLGPYAFVTPIAMICACMAVTARHRMTAEEARLQREASAYIRPAGDLPIIRR